MKSGQLSRRDFLRYTGMAGAGVVLAACAPAAVPGAAPAASSGGGQAPVELVHWDWWVTQGPWFDEEVQLFQDANPGIVVNRVMQREMDQALPLAYAEGTLPDFYMGGPSLSEQVSNDKILAYDLASFDDFEAWKQTFPNPDLDFAPGINVFDGRVFTAPRESRSAWWNQVFANLNILEEHGIELPDTAEQFLEACRKITQDSGRQVFGYANGFATGWMNMLVEFQCGRDAFVGGNDYRTNKSTYGSNPAFAQILELLATLSEEGLILPEAASIDDEGMRAMFADGKVAFINGGMWNVNGWKQTHPDFSNYTIIPPILFGDSQTYTFGTGPGQTGTPFFIGSTTKHPAETWLWYKWLHTPASGERWVKSGNGLSIFPQANNPEFMTDKVWQDYVAWDPKLNRVAPQPAVRNPETGKLSAMDAEPNFATITGGVYSGQIKKADIPGVLAKLAEDKDRNFLTALQDAQNAGVAVEFDDWVFPDWNPMEDYVTTPKA